MSKILKTAKEWIKQFGDDSVRVGEGLSDQIMSQAEFESEVEKEMGNLPQNIYRNEGIFAGEDSQRTTQAIADLKRVRKELVKATPAERDELLEKAIEVKGTERAAKTKRVLKPQKESSFTKEDEAAFEKIMAQEEYKDRPCVYIPDPEAKIPSEEVPKIEPLSPEQEASLKRGIEDSKAGRVTPTKKGSKKKVDKPKKTK